MASRLRHLCLCLCLCVCMMWVSIYGGITGVERIARAGGCRLQLSRENRRGGLVGGRAVCVGMAGVVQFTCTCMYAGDCAWREMRSRASLDQ